MASGREEKSSKTRIECRKCRYFYITWDNAMPYGCRAYGFKTHIMPALEVFRSSGKPCQVFADKTPSV